MRSLRLPQSMLALMGFLLLELDLERELFFTLRSETERQNVKFKPQTSDANLEKTALGGSLILV